MAACRSSRSSPARPTALLFVAFGSGQCSQSVGANLIAEQLQRWHDRAEPVSENEVIAWIQDNVVTEAALLPALDSIIAKLDAVTTVQSGLDTADREWFTQILRQELTQLGNKQQYSAVLQGSGAIAQGDRATAVGERGVNVGGSVGGNINTGDTYIDKQIVQAKDKEAEALLRAEQRYLQRMIRYCNALPLAAMGGDDGIGEEISLDQVYIDLDTTRRVPLTDEDKAQGGRTRRTSPEEEKARPLPILEAITQQRQMVILGEPGSGKSTFLRQLSAWLAGALLYPEMKAPPPGWQPMFPIIVTLRELAQRLEGLTVSPADSDRDRQLLEAVHDQWQHELREHGAPELSGVLEDWLLAGRVILLFDGLDEVGLPVRQRIRQAVKVVRATYDVPVLVTCRVRSYTGTAVLSGFATETLAPFDKDKIKALVSAWYQAQVVLGRLTPSVAEEKTADLQQAATSKDLLELAANPMLLTTMAIVHQGNVGLPKERVRLYSLAVQVLLRRWQKAKGLAQSSELAALLEDDRKMRHLLHGLAYETHKLQETAGRGANLERWDILKLLEQPQYLGSLGLAEQFLEYVDRRAGLLVGQGGGETGQKPASYGFPHRTFQEYLAGCYMVTGRNPARNYWSHMGSSDYWYLAAELGSEELLYNNPQGQIQFLDLAYALCPTSEPTTAAHWRGVVWAGRMATLLPPEEIVADDTQPDGGAVYLARQIPRLVSALAEMSLERGERAAAGRSLARLGDPRPEVMTIEGMRFCYVPRGPFWMGSGDNDPDARDNEKPLHQLDLPYSYWLGEYPVTNAQFGQFIAAGGYADASFWPEAIRHGFWRDGYFKGRFDNEPRNRPDDYGEPFTLSNHPVVGVAWYEAMAFTRWLTKTQAETLPAGWSFSLPSEAEWEKAARGGIDLPHECQIAALADIHSWEPAIEWQPNPVPRRRFPWASNPDTVYPNLANYDESGIGVPTAPGCFPGNAAPYGARDMGGNVWEWTRNIQQSYPYRLDL